MFFDRVRRLRTLQAAVMHYQDEIAKKDRVLRSCGETIQQAERMQRVLEECNDALAAENRRIGENRDLDEDMMSEMWGEYKAMLREIEDIRKLREENYRLWVENAILRGELASTRPEKAAEIAGRCAP